MNMLNPITVAAFSLVAVLGLCLGSFATALAARIPDGTSWIMTRKTDACRPARSHCMSCGHTLGAKDLIPLFSWLISCGHCRYCNSSISCSYPLMEAAAMMITIALFTGWGFAWPAFPLYAAVPFFLAAIVIDWRHMILPDVLNAILFVAALCHVGLLSLDGGHGNGLIYDRALAATALLVVFFIASSAISILKKTPALGMGDLKFLPAAGLFLGMHALPLFCIMSGILGIFIAFLRRNHENGRFPFGPALIASVILHLFLTGIGFDYRW